MAVTESDVTALLIGSVATLNRWCQANAAFPEAAATRFVANPTLTTANAFAAAVQPLIHRLVSVVEFRYPQLAPAAHEILLAQLGPVLLTNWIAAATSTEISVAMGLAAELRGWLVDIRATGVSASAEVRVTTIHPPPARVERAVPAASITYVQTAALDQQLAGRRNQEYALKLSRIRSLLGVSAAEVARLLGVSREAVRQWEAGAAISEDRWPSIDRLFETCRRLSTYFKIESLPSVVRRSVPALGNQSPLEWLIMQKQDELLAVYERAFGFGVTQ